MATTVVPISKLIILVGLLVPLAALAQSPSGSAGGGGGAGGNAGGGASGGNAGGGGSQGGNAGAGNGTPSSRGQAAIPYGLGPAEWPVNLSGRVILASGGTPPERVKIRRVCPSGTTVEGYSDAKGRFNFRVGANASLAIVDASYGGRTVEGNSQSFSGNFDSAQSSSVTGCTLEVDAPGYTSNVIVLDRRGPGDNPEVGTFILTPLGGTKASVVSATSLAAPKEAKSAFNKALNELSKGKFSKPEKAIRYLEEAVSIYPGFAAAWTVLGQVRGEQGELEAAVEALEKALQLDPRYLTPYSALAELMMAKGNWMRGLELANFVLGITPNNVQMRWFQAIAQYEMQNRDEAVAALTALQSEEAGDQQYPQSHHILGLIYAGRGQFPLAAVEYRRFLELSPKAYISDSVRRTLYEWEQLGVI